VIGQFHGAEYRGSHFDVWVVQFGRRGCRGIGSVMRGETEVSMMSPNSKRSVGGAACARRREGALRASWGWGTRCSKNVALVRATVDRGGALHSRDSEAIVSGRPVNLAGGGRVVAGAMEGAAGNIVCIVGRHCAPTRPFTEAF